MYFSFLKAVQSPHSLVCDAIEFPENSKITSLIQINSNQQTVNQ